MTKEERGDYEDECFKTRSLEVRLDQLEKDYLNMMHKNQFLTDLVQKLVDEADHEGWPAPVAGIAKAYLRTHK